MLCAVVFSLEPDAADTFGARSILPQAQEQENVPGYRNHKKQENVPDLPCAIHAGTGCTGAEKISRSRSMNRKSPNLAMSRDHRRLAQTRRSRPA
jgi:hypothetical protein